MKYPQRKLPNTSKILTKRNVSLLLALLLIPCYCYSKKRPIPLLLVSIDGFRYDYIEKYSPPTLRRIKDQGFQAKSLIPIYPSKTFPNHYSIITGLTAKNHGIISNSFLDRRRRNQVFKISDKNKVNDGFWYEGEPIWVTASKNGLKTASYFWVGSEALIKGVRPDYYKKYDFRDEGAKRVDQIINWLRLPSVKRPSFLTLYFSKVDSAGHRYGTNSPKLKSAIFDIDDSIGRLIRKLKKEKIICNILIVSDHGMRDVFPEGHVDLPKELLSDKNIKIVGKGTLSLIYVKDKSLIKKYFDLLKTSNKWYTYKQRDIPKTYSFIHKHRAPDILLEAKLGNYITLGTRKETSAHGTHGYNPEDKQMHGILLGIGPNIKNIKIGPIKNIDLFPFMGKLLNLKDLPKVDGTIDSLKSVYKDNLNNTGK